MVKGAKGEDESWAEREREEEEYVPLHVPEEFRSVAWEESKVKVREVWQRYLGQELILEPEFQRHYVWDPTRASRYIESLLLRLPTPAIFIAEEQDGLWAVIDGHQRLETVFRFLQPVLQGPTAAAGKTQTKYTVLTPLTLRALEVLPELNGKGVVALSIEDRSKLWDTELSVIRLPKSVHSDMKYALFARLNQGSMSLNSQELRNCLYRGPYNKLIASLGEDYRFLTLWKKNEPDKRMRHRELVLRVFALLHRMDRYRRPFRSFLNDEMETNRNLDPVSAERFRQEFAIACTWVDRVFGQEAFRLFRRGDTGNPPGRWGKPRNDLLFELEMVGFAQAGALLEKTWSSLTDADRKLFAMAVRRRLVDVMVLDRFVDAFSEGTTDPGKLRRRFELWTQALGKATNEPDALLRDAKVLHQKLIQSNVCAICPNQVGPDDAAWASTEGAQRLVHRFCQTPSA